MSDSNGTELHPAFWLLRQIHYGLSHPDWFINIRCIHNKTPYVNPDTGRIEKLTEITFDECIQIKEFKQRWHSDLFLTLAQRNSENRPSNIYFGVNPLITKGHKKENFAGYNSLYLDCDDNKSYSKEQRWGQIHYWKLIGFPPSIVIDSGHGYHVYWLLKRMLEAAKGEEVLRRMVQLSGCRDKGNTFDVARVLRLPGFTNTKEWYTQNTPPCFIAIPEHWQQLPEVLRYDPELFEGFPPSDLVDLQRYYAEAAKVSSTEAELKANLDKIVLAAGAAARQAVIIQAGQRIYAQGMSRPEATAVSIPSSAVKRPPFEPTLQRVPVLDEIKWPHRSKWMKKYCAVGHGGMTQGDLDELKIKYGMQDVSASELDFKIIYFLVRRGYMHEGVREFWTRPGHALHRPDKEQKNPNYFDMTYDKALEFARAGLEQGDPLKRADKDQINLFMHGGQTFVQNGEAVESILTAEVKIKHIFEDRDAAMPGEREWYELDAFSIYPNGERKDYSILLANEAFSSLVAFKRYTHDIFRLVTNNAAYLQRLAEHLLNNQDIVRMSYNSKVIYKNEQYIFPTFIVAKDAIHQRKIDVLYDALKDRLPFFSHFQLEHRPQEETVERLKQLWPNVLQMHLPELISAVLGTVVAAAIKPRLQHCLNIDTFHIPTLNVRGSSTTAKTETIRHLLTVTGQARNKITTSAQTSQFALTRLLNGSNFIPVVLDEFKETEMKPSQPAIIRELVRRIYSGESMYRGQKDLSVTKIDTQGNLIILGESVLERIGDISEISRIVAVDTSTFNPAKHVNNWMALEHANWYELGPLLYQFLLRQDLQALYQEFRQLKTNTIEALEDLFGGEKVRIGHNIAVLRLGCILFDRFILSLDPGLPTLNEVCSAQSKLVANMKTWALDFEHSFTYDVEEPVTVEQDGTVVTRKTRKKHVVPQDELLFAFRKFGELIELKNDIVQSKENTTQFLYAEDESKNSLYLNLVIVQNIFTEWCHKYKERVPSGVGKYKSLLKSLKANHPELLLDPEPKSIRYKYGIIRAYQFNLKLMRESGVWPPKERMSSAPSAEQSNNEQNPNSDSGTDPFRIT